MTALSHPSTPGLSPRKRIAVFASYSKDGYLPPQVLPYLKGLQPLTDAIVFVCDNDLAPGEREKLRPHVAHIIAGRHGEYDFGSYKRGTLWARDNGLLEGADDLILCNDSCFGPVGSFQPMFSRMEARGLDFWGATDSHQFGYHLQSYWVVLTRKVFTSDAFTGFIEGVTKQEDVKAVILKYELGLSKTLLDAGFKCGAMVENDLKGVHPDDRTYANAIIFPLYTFQKGLPFVKVKALHRAECNLDGTNRTLAWLKNNASELYSDVTSDIDIQRFEEADDVAFSIVMPTFNRAWCIETAIRAVLAQTHRNYELIIVDDGSSDGTEALVREIFATELAEKRIRYIPLPENVGVCNARNIGLSFARNPWIAYADTDNAMRPYYLTVMANAITQHPNRDAAYCQIIHVNSGRVIGKPFNRDELPKQNHIDLGVFVHRKSLVGRFGGFDVEMRRLVDWDLAIRYTRHKDPAFLPIIGLDYNDEEHGDRISVSESFIRAHTIIHLKHRPEPAVSTVILTYNHEKYIVEAIESALSQKGNFRHEILISDDGSTDGTQRIIERYAAKHPTRIRNISRGGNHGISENYRHCFREAAGEVVAVLEGDDYWTDPEKNLRQAERFRADPEVVMAFSRIELLNMQNGTRRTLRRQDGLPPIITGKHIVDETSLNPFANFSSTMFRKQVMTTLPRKVFLPRLNEITLGLYLDRIGKIAFLDKVMGVYRLNPDSVWTGADQESKHLQAISIRENALRFARPAYRGEVLRHLNQKRSELEKLRASQTKVA